ncbi:hypothetical protein OGM23_03635 [Dickeya fangzhongdai]|uniref:hypothetical protein n=1 Tax=Dickeya fangzhongdai TaxID=1778540 RepID=UPI002B2F577A|nr:hypothetical protein OGM23_03635 [Dickeya fangzhongdai]
MAAGSPAPLDEHTLHQKQQNTQIQKYALFCGVQFTKKVHRSSRPTRQSTVSRLNKNNFKNKLITQNRSVQPVSRHTIAKICTPVMLKSTKLHKTTYRLSNLIVRRLAVIMATTDT